MIEVRTPAQPGYTFEHSPYLPTEPTSTGYKPLTALPLAASAPSRLRPGAPGVITPRSESPAAWLRRASALRPSMGMQRSRTVGVPPMSARSERHATGAFVCCATTCFGTSCPILALSCPSRRQCSRSSSSRSEACSSRSAVSRKASLGPDLLTYVLERARCPRLLIGMFYATARRICAQRICNCTYT